MSVKKSRRSIIKSSRFAPLSSFFDNFSLSSGLRSGWRIVSGTWSSNSGTLQSQTSASAYPIIIKDMQSENIDMFVKSPTNGTGIAFWVTDSGNWWSAGIKQEATDCNCTPTFTCTGYGCTGYGCTSSGCCSTGCTSSGCTGYGCTNSGCTETGCTLSGCTSYGCVLSGCLGYTCGAYAGGYCVYYSCTGGYGCAGYGCSNYGCLNSGCTGYGCTASGCISSGCTGYGCTSSGCCATGCTSTGCTSGINGQVCSTCYPRSIMLLKSAISVVSTVATWALSNATSSLRLKTNGTEIEITAYSDLSGTIVIDTPVTHTASSGIPTKKYGLLVSPNSYQQGNSVGEITIMPN
jgi:hypothetical protein